MTEIKTKANWVMLLFTAIAFLYPSLIMAEMKIDTIRIELVEPESLTVISMEGNKLGTPSHLNYSVYLNCEKLISPDSIVDYHFEAVYYSPGDFESFPLLIDNTAPLLFLVDGKKFSLDPVPPQPPFPGSTHPTMENRVSYPVSKEFLAKVIAAKEVQIRITGERYYLDCPFTEENFKNFKTFYDAYVSNPVESDTAKVEE